MTDEQNVLRDRLRDWQEAEARHARCVQETEYDYFCFADRQRADECGAAFFAALDAYVDARVASKSLPQRPAVTLAEEEGNPKLRAQMRSGE